MTTNKQAPRTRANDEPAFNTNPRPKKRHDPMTSDIDNTEAAYSSVHERLLFTRQGATRPWTTTRLFP